MVKAVRFLNAVVCVYQCNWIYGTIQVKLFVCRLNDVSLPWSLLSSSKQMSLYCLELGIYVPHTVISVSVAVFSFSALCAVNLEKCFHL